MVDVDVPAAAPLRRPTAAARRTLCWAQLLLGGAVVLAAVAVGGVVQDRIDDRAAVARPEVPVVLDEARVPSAKTVLARGAVDGHAHDHSASGANTVVDGALAGLGTLIVGATLTASVGTVGRRRLDDRESARWEGDWARVEPEWSGRVRWDGP